MRVVFMGTPAFAETSLRALCAAGFDLAGVISQPDRPAGRGRQPVSPPVADAARELGLPLIQPPNPHTPETLETLRRWAPDAIVVVAYGVILRPALLDLPPCGCVNVHASLLPRHRGSCPIHQAILAGDAETGVTIMRLDAGMDSGPILAQRAVPIHESDTTGTLTPALAQLGADLLVETLPAYLQGEITPQPQDHARATYAGMLCKADGRIDWDEPAVQIVRRVRAFDPWPGTCTHWEGRLLKIIEAEPVDAPPAPPGTVMDLAGQPAVAAGVGALLLRLVQLAGKKPTDGASFARGRRGFIGSVLGGA